MNADVGQEEAADENLSPTKTTHPTSPNPKLEARKSRNSGVFFRFFTGKVDGRKKRKSGSAGGPGSGGEASRKTARPISGARQAASPDDRKDTSEAKRRTADSEDLTKPPSPSGKKLVPAEAKAPKPKKVVLQTTSPKARDAQTKLPASRIKKVAPRVPAARKPAPKKVPKSTSDVSIKKKTDSANSMPKRPHSVEVSASTRPPGRPMSSGDKGRAVSPGRPVSSGGKGRAVSHGGKGRPISTGRKPQKMLASAEKAQAKKTVPSPQKVSKKKVKMHPSKRPPSAKHKKKPEPVKVAPQKDAERKLSSDQEVTDADKELEDTVKENGEAVVVFASDLIVDTLSSVLKGTYV